MAYFQPERNRPSLGISHPATGRATDEPTEWDKRDATGLTFGVTSFYAYNILQNVVTGKHQRELSLRNYAECRRLTVHGVLLLPLEITRLFTLKGVP